MWFDLKVQDYLVFFKCISITLVKQTGNVVILSCQWNITSFNSLWLRNAIWRHSRSSLASAKPSNYLNRCVYITKCIRKCQLQNVGLAFFIAWYVQLMIQRGAIIYLNDLDQCRHMFFFQDDNLWWNMHQTLLTLMKPYFLWGGVECGSGGGGRG